MPKCKGCGSNMLKGYLRLDQETTSQIWVCPRSEDLHMELVDSDLLFYCTGHMTKKSKK